MKPHTAQVQAAVQQLLMEHGEYVPLELLLATNRLAYEDYRAWREGRLETLDAVLADGQRESCAWLEAAQSWACALALTAEPTVHHGWAENAGTGLVASIDPRLNGAARTLGIGSVRPAPAAKRCIGQSPHAVSCQPLQIEVGHLTQAGEGDFGVHRGRVQAAVPEAVSDLLHQESLVQ